MPVITILEGIILPFYFLHSSVTSGIFLLTPSFPLTVNNLELSRFLILLLFPFVAVRPA